MTVAELIARLQVFPPEVRVVVNGYEGGYSDLTPGRVQGTRLRLHCMPRDWYYGQHARVGSFDAQRRDSLMVTEADAVVLSRGNVIEDDDADDGEEGA